MNAVGRGTSSRCLMQVSRQTVIFTDCRPASPHACIRKSGMPRHSHAAGKRITFCCRIMLMALCVTCSFTPARATTFVAARTARVPHGPKAACIHGRIACAFGGQG